MAIIAITIATMCVNALNGLSSFLQHGDNRHYHCNNVCQRPERAFFISTIKRVLTKDGHVTMCQRPERAFFISTKLWRKLHGRVVCQRPERAFFISTYDYFLSRRQKEKGVNALNGLSSFLHYGSICKS